jgi:hypothetical protein
MPVEALEFAEPFFEVTLVAGEPNYNISGRAIALNLGETSFRVSNQTIPPLQSAIVHDALIADAGFVLLIQQLNDDLSDDALMEQIRAFWPSAFDVRGEERLRGVGHYMSPKTWVGQFGFTMYHSATVPLNVGLHKDHDFCPVPGFREVHTQILGFGKMQQCREKDIATLYLEEPMAPGTTHRPMYDADGNYPWHQFETITPSVFLAVEMLPEGASPP